MARNLKFIGLIVLLMFGSSVCNPKKSRTQLKYEEDPAETTKTPEERLSGTWDLSDYSFKGKSIKDSLGKIFGSRKDEIKQVWLNYGQLDKEKILRLGGGVGAVVRMHGVFDRTDITMSADAPDSAAIMWFITPFRFQKTQLRTSWRVTKLFQNNLNLVLGTDSGEYKLFFIHQ